MKLGINGFGRIGKLTLWHHVARKFFDEITVNIGRQPGTGLKDVMHYIERDSTYGSLGAYLHGHQGSVRCAECIDEWTGKQLLIPASVPRSITINAITPVGNYAIAIAWSDGHASGIYPWERLRALETEQ